MIPTTDVAVTPGLVSQALGVAVPTGPDDLARFTGVSTDSREVEPGNLFVALAGRRTDGHAFIEEALRRGARGVIHRSDARVVLPACVSQFPVADTLVAYRSLAREWRRQFTLPVIAVAGSAGKTTTKELLGAILAGRFDHVLLTEESRNGYVGVPSTLLRIKPLHRAAVIEVGIDARGAMQEHMAIVGATASIVTMIGPEHLENLVDVPTVAREEGYALATVAAAGGTTVVNLDDPWLRPFHGDHGAGRSVGYSLHDGVAGDNVLRGTFEPCHSMLKIRGLGLSNVAIRLPLPGTHNAANLLGAIATARVLGLAQDEIEHGLSRVRLPPGRSEIHELAGSVRVICDVYNANPASMVAALELLRTQSRTRWACLGDMLELGRASDGYHRDLARLLLDLEVHHVLLFGSATRIVQEQLRALGFDGDCRYFATHADLAEALAREVMEDSVVLIKGSRGMQMERVWVAFQTARAARHGEIQSSSGMQ